LFVVYVRNVIGYIWLLAIGLLWQQYQPENLDYYQARTWTHWKRKHLIVAPLSLVAFAAGYAWYLSIPLLQISINTVVYNCNSPIVFMLSLIVLRERMNWMKILSVVICAFGVLLITVGPIGSGQFYSSEEEMLGIGLVLLSMVFFALYAVLMKWIELHPYTRVEMSGPIPHSPHLVAVSESLNVLGLLGFWNLLLIPPVLYVAHVLQWETFELPADLETWCLLFLNAAANTLFNVGLLIGIAFASPFVVSMGLVLSIPIAVFLDLFIHDYVMTLQGLGGASCVIIGFVFMTYSEYYRPRKEPSST